MAWFNRATLHLARGLVPQAIADYREAWRLNPADPSPAINLAILFNDLGQPDDALECCQGIVDRGGDSAMIRHLAAAALRALGRVDESIAAYRASLALAADPAQHSNLLYELNFQTNSEPAAVFAEHLAWAAQHAEPLTAASPPHANDRTPNRKLRIGYVSPHFRDHAVKYFTEPLLAAHDRQRFEVFCYSDWPIGDAVTARLQASADHWRNVHGASDEDVANQIRADRIDILVDLTGHIGENRLLLFARKPAPIQVTYLGYQNTTGMSAMDYRLTDEWADPPDQTDRFYTERLVRLPRSFFCYRPDDDAPPVSPLPALATGQVTFGSFNLFAKVNSHVIECWLDILARAGLAAVDPGQSRRIRRAASCTSRAQARGIDPGRIEVCPRPPARRVPATGAASRRRARSVSLQWPHDHLRRDLDGGAGRDARRPNVRLERFGGSVLANVGLDHLITKTRQQYADASVALAADLPALARLRGELRPRMASLRAARFRRFHPQRGSRLSENVGHVVRKRGGLIFRGEEFSCHDHINARWAKTKAANTLLARTERKTLR